MQPLSDTSATDASEERCAENKTDERQHRFASSTCNR